MTDIQELGNGNYDAQDDLGIHEIQQQDMERSKPHPYEEKEESDANHRDIIKDPADPNEGINEAEKNTNISHYRAPTRNVVTGMAYLLGVKDDMMSTVYKPDCPDLLESLQRNGEAKTIRLLSMIRTSMLRNYKQIDMNLRMNLINIESMPEYINPEDVQWLRANGIEIYQANSSVNQYLPVLNKLIYDRIDHCRNLFPDWVEWKFLRALFLMPGCYASTSRVKTSERIALKTPLDRAKIKYWNNSIFYPFQVYIDWPAGQMEDNGNILYNDQKFLTLLYGTRNIEFSERGYVQDAAPETKNNIYGFIGNSRKVVLIVDCENSDVYKLYATLHNLNEEYIRKITKIILYDDSHTTPAWNMLSKYVSVPVEHVYVARVAERKSLVDIRMTAGACQEYYENGVDSFILATSDSDCWGIVSSLPDADFLVLIEYSKCGQAIRDAMSERQIYYCALDDFSKGNIDRFKSAVFQSRLQERIDRFNSQGIWRDFDPDALVEDIFAECRFSGTEKQIARNKGIYYNRYLKNGLRLVITTDKKKNRRFILALNES